jgi:hypothetical protein
LPKLYLNQKELPMNPQQAWNFAIDELEGSPTARAAAECRIVAYDDKPGNRTLTVLAPNQAVAYVITGNQALISKLTFGLDILSLNLVVDVAEDTEKAPKSPASAAWEKVLEILRQEAPPASFDTWIRDTQAVELANGILTVAARNAYARDWLENRIQESGSKLASKIIGQDVTLRFVVGRESSQPETPMMMPGGKKMTTSNPDGTNFRKVSTPLTRLRSIQTVSLQFQVMRCACFSKAT